MSITTQGFRIVFDNIFRRLERKISGATMELVGTLLKNAGLDEGEWILKDSHRIKKKGRERFHVIRVESRSGAKSVRVWCKPRGNDSCFEYSLVPPAGIDADDVFHILKRANPVTLEVAESPTLPGVFLSHVIDAPPKLAIPERTQAVEVKEEPPAAEEAPEEEINVPAPLGENRPAGGLIKPQETNIEFSLAVDEPCLLSDQEVMDKALLAISFVSVDGYAKKIEASNSIIKNLKIREFVENISGGTYTSVEGAMRALTMALSNRGHYIQKLHYPSGEGVRGYKLTAKAERRILALREKYGIAGGHVKVVDVSEPNGGEEEGITHSEASEELNRFESGDLDRLQALIKECKEAENHIREVDAVIINLDAEISDLQIDMEALDLAERERLRQIEELNRDIERIRAKKGPIAESMNQKRLDREGWERDKAPVAAKKSEIEMEIFGVTGRRRSN